MAKPKKTVSKSAEKKTTAEQPSSDVSKSEAITPEDKPSVTKPADVAPATASTPAAKDDAPAVKSSGAEAKENAADASAKTSASDATKAAPASTEDTPKSTTSKADPAPKTSGTNDSSALPKTTGKATDDGNGKSDVKAASPSRASAAASVKTTSKASEKPEPAKAAPTTSPAPAPAPKERKRSVFFPMLLGGAIAAGLGFAAAEYDVLGTRAESEADSQAALKAQQTRIAELEARLDEPAALPETLPQVDALAETMAEELAAARQELAALQEQLTGIDSRLTTVEKQPATGAATETAVAAFEREMEALRNAVTEQRNEIESLLENAQTAEEATAEAAEAARAQTAMTRVNTALAAGRPFDTALTELEAAGVSDIPQALTDTAGSGIVTLANLQARYPDAARAALATARAEVPQEGEGGFGSFLKRQLGARSVAPREGTDPDAVLSRAEAAVRDGRLTDALAEIDTLPDPAQEAMSDWLADARARQAAENAADDLSQRLTAN